MLQTFFGDDEHTAADGPYIRIMRARKWLLGTAALAIAFNMQLLDLAAITNLIKILKLSEHIFKITLITTIIYLSVQYSIIAIQVAVVYDIIISDRMRSRRDEEIRIAQARLDDSRKEVITIEGEAASKNATSFPRRGKLGDGSQPAIDAATSVYNRHINELAMLVNKDPSNRSFYKIADYVIDAIRISVRHAQHQAPVAVRSLIDHPERSRAR